MPKNLEVNVLLDFYGDMLTEKQREVTELYYEEDLSLAEIAEHSGITRQGVRDSIKRAEFQLFDYEEKLGLYARFMTIQEGLTEISEHARELLGMYSSSAQNAEAFARTRRIMEISDSLNEDK